LFSEINSCWYILQLNKEWKHSKEDTDINNILDPLSITTYLCLVVEVKTNLLWDVRWTVNVNGNCKSCTTSNLSCKYNETDSKFDMKQNGTCGSCVLCEWCHTTITSTHCFSQKMTEKTKQWQLLGLNKFLNLVAK
jgi:hypothetical protein